jgi:hypothetical protein
MYFLKMLTLKKEKRGVILELVKCFCRRFYPLIKIKYTLLKMSFKNKI